jgi:hypothetical protein
MLFSGPFDTLDNVRHAARTVGTQDLDSDGVSLLGNTITLSGDGTSAVRTVTVTIFIRVTVRDSGTPFGTTIKVDVLDINTGIDDIDLDTLTTLGFIVILAESTKVEGFAVGDTGQTPGSIALQFTGIDYSVPLNVSNLQG